jgi:hypothetical protein
VSHTLLCIIDNGGLGTRCAMEGCIEASTCMKCVLNFTNNNRMVNDCN